MWLGPFKTLGRLYGAQRRYTKAEELFRRTLVIREKRPEHPAMIRSVQDLAQLYCKQGRYHEAEKLYKEVYLRFENMLGPEHPHLANLKGELQRQNITKSF